MTAHTLQFIPDERSPGSYEFNRQEPTQINGLQRATWKHCMEQDAAIEAQDAMIQAQQRRLAVAVRTLHEAIWILVLMLAALVGAFWAVVAWVPA